MSEFFSDLLRHGFLQRAIAAGILASIACGVIGSYVVVRRIVFVSGGIAHAVLGGMGIAYYLGANPMIGALVAAIVSALVIGIVSLKIRQREDTVIGALWAIGMAIGILFISQTPGYNVDLMSYLFGNILMVGSGDLYLIAILDAIVIAAVILLYKQILAFSFDTEYARLQGVAVDRLYLAMLCLIALTVVILVQVVGIILVIALLVLPAATAGLFCRSLAGMMALASAVGLLVTLGGLAFSYAPDFPAGASIILLAGFVYLVALVYRSLKARFRSNHYADEQEAKAG